MKIRALCILCSCFVMQAGQRTIVDEVRVVIYDTDGAHIILNSDMRRNLDGSVQKLPEVVVSELMLLDAQRFNVTVTEEQVERYLAELQKTNGLSRAALESIMSEMGYTYEEGKEHLRKRQMREHIVDFKVKSDKRFIVLKEDVETFDEQHPEFSESYYVLQQAVAPDPSMADKDLAAIPAQELQWEEPFSVKESELADDKRFIISQKEGAIVDRALVDEGVELTRLVEKHPARRRSVDERYDTIMNILHAQRFQALLKEYQDELLKNATVAFTYPQDKILVMGEERP